MKKLGKIMIRNKLLAIALLIQIPAFSPCMHQSQDANQKVIQRWKLKIIPPNQSDFECAEKTFTQAQSALKDHVISGSLDHIDNGTEISLRLKGNRSELLEKLKSQPWFEQKNLQEE
jgi:hypothetical protein